MLSIGARPVDVSTAEFLDDLVRYLRENRTRLRDEWVQRIVEEQLLMGMTRDEILVEATFVYDSYLELLETGTAETLQTYARTLSQRIIRRGSKAFEVLGLLLLLRDVLVRALFRKYGADPELFERVLDAYQPTANRVALAVGVSFVRELVGFIHQQQEAIRELSIPALPVRERLLILPVIGAIDQQRVRQLTDQLLRSIRANRAKVVVMDVTGVPAVDVEVANHLVQSLEAARLLGATVIVTGLSPEMTQTLVAVGVDLSKMTTVGDLQRGMEKAERLLG